MFRCRECKGWLKIGKIDTEISNQNCKIKVQNMPVKVCPKCGKIYIYDIEKDILMPLLKNVSDCWFDGIIDNNKICYRENRDTKTRRRMIEHILEITES